MSAAEITWFRDRSKMLRLSGGSLSLGLVTALGMLTAIVSEPTLVGLLLQAPLAYAALRMGLNLRRAGVAITSSHVVIRGPWTEHSYTLAEVERFVGTVFAETGGVAVQLIDGRRVPVWALATHFGLVHRVEQHAEAWQPMATRLNDLLAQARCGLCQSRRAST